MKLHSRSLLALAAAAALTLGVLAVAGGHLPSVSTSPVAATGIGSPSPTENKHLQAAQPAEPAETPEPAESPEPGATPEPAESPEAETAKSAAAHPCNHGFYVSEAAHAKKGGQYVSSIAKSDLGKHSDCTAPLPTPKP